MNDKNFKAASAQVKVKNKVLKEKYGKLYDEALALFFKHDPMGINFESNKDEYSPEVGTILPRLSPNHSQEDVLAIVNEEFQRWFGEDSEGKNYKELSLELFDLYKDYCNSIK